MNSLNKQSLREIFDFTFLSLPKNYLSAISPGHDFHINENGDCSRHEKISFSLSGPQQYRNIANLNVSINLMFLLLDNMVDMLYPEYIGSSFKEKYKNINIDNIDFGNEIKVIYRIYKVLRNTVIHNASELLITNGIIRCEYKFYGTDFKVKLTERTFSYLNGIIYYISNFIINRDRVNQGYYSMIISYLYDIVSTNIEIEDEIEDCLYSSKNKKLRHPNRERVYPSNFEVIKNKLFIQRKLFKIKNEILYMNNKKEDKIGIDMDVEVEILVSNYILEIKDKKYMIPDEALELNNNNPSKGIICMKELEKFNHVE